jgi:hypothetical protein
MDNSHAVMLRTLKSVIAHVECRDLDRVGSQCTLCHTYRTMIHNAIEVAERWHPIATAPEKRIVMTKIDDEPWGPRNVQPMTRDGNLWWLDYGTLEAMFVYYQPTHWREVDY